MSVYLPQSLRDALISAGASPRSLEQAIQRASTMDELGTLLAQDGLAENHWASILAEDLGLPYAPDVDLTRLDPAVLEAVSLPYCRKNRLLPILSEDGRLLVATADPLRDGALDDLRSLYRMEPDAVVVPGKALTSAIHAAFDRAASGSSQMDAQLRDDDSLQATAAELADAPDLLEADDEAPIIRLVNSIIFQAARDGASDVHIEPFERGTSVRFRVDGMLAEVLAPPRRIHSALVSRIKVMASMNIAERRLPQDGGIRTRVAGRELDVRVSTVPTSFGERVVLRLLDRSATLMGLDEIGFTSSLLKDLRRLIHQSHGIVLVTGPTGSGKTTTLYGALSEINTPDKNIITIEDPVEYQLKGIGQIQVNPKIDLTFAGGLRAVLRQDPDVIMVGEIRDAETARIAIQAALTGHLVFSTLHTNDSFSAVTRLLDMGVEPFLVSSSVIGIMAQRLVRQLCPDCSVPARKDDPGLLDLGLQGVSHNAAEPGPGCESCRGSGYRGRMAIAELFTVDDQTRSLMMQSTDAATLREDCVRRGMQLMRRDGADRVRAGQTSAAEVLRVTAEDSAD